VTLRHEDLVRRRDVAVRVARAAGALAQQLRVQLAQGKIKVSEKGPQDFVTEADQTVEAFIRKQLSDAFPEDGVMGEEFGGGTSNKLTWVVDPIDGTANYIRNIPQWCISIALVGYSKVLAGIVYDPCENMAYCAIANGGAFCNGKVLRPVRPATISNALIILGASRKSEINEYAITIKRLHDDGAETRRFGSAALGLAYVATGRADAYYEAVLNSWDALAGLLIAQEAGAIAFTPELSTFLSHPGPVLCSAPCIAQQIVTGLPSHIEYSLFKWQRNAKS